eukprot:366073-Chlamydomonas_euryale.AAC.2
MHNAIWSESIKCGSTWMRMDPGRINLVESPKEKFAMCLACRHNSLYPSLSSLQYLDSLKLKDISSRRIPLHLHPLLAVVMDLPALVGRSASACVHGQSKRLDKVPCQRA